MSGDLTFTAAPLVPLYLLAGIGVLALLFLAAMWGRRARGAAWRSAAVLGLLLALINPTAVVEERRPLPDVVLVVVDESPSQAIGERRQRTETALETVQSRLAAQKELEVRVVRAGSGSGLGGAREGTRLFEAMERALGDVPRSRLSGVVMIFIIC